MTKLQVSHFSTYCHHIILTELYFLILEVRYQTHYLFPKINQSEMFQYYVVFQRSSKDCTRCTYILHLSMCMYIHKHHFFSNIVWFFYECPFFLAEKNSAKFGIKIEWGASSLPPLFSWGSIFTIQLRTKEEIMHISL